MLVGTGVACATKDYGTGADGSLGSCRDRSARARSRSIAITSRWATAIGTALANRVARHLGGIADEVALARIDSFGCARARHLRRSLHDGSGDAGRRGSAIRAGCRRSAPRRTASIGAHVGTHAAAEAARIIFRFGLWPAALELWGITPADPRAKQWEAATLAGRATGDAGTAAAGLAGRSPPRRMRAMA